MIRRDFLKYLSAAALPASLSASSDKWGAVLPKRVLGRTGVPVTLLGLGGYHIGWTSEAEAAATIETALAGGIRFFDTAESYGPETSEIRYGQYLTPQYRDEIYLMTKSTERNPVEARKHLEGSLRRMKTDWIDLWQIHSLRDSEDADRRVDNGILEMALKAQAEGKIRHIGFTGHRDPRGHSRILERTAQMDSEPFHACQFPVNPVDLSSNSSFIRDFMPAAQGRDLGLIAMKSLADGRFFAKKSMPWNESYWTTEDPLIPEVLTVEDCTRFALSLPVATLVVGAEKPAFVEDKIQVAQAFTAMGPSAREAAIQKVARFAAAAEVEYYKEETLRPPA